MNLRKKFPYIIGLLILGLIAIALVFPFTGGAARVTQTKSGEGLPNFDAFGASTKRSAAIAQDGAQSSGQPQSEGGHLVQSEPRLGVPTFLWASESGPARSAVELATQFGSQNGAAGAAKAHLSRYGARYRLAPEDIANARVAGVHDTGKGAIIVKFKQDIDGVEVFHDEMNVIMNRQFQLIAISGYLSGQKEGAGTTAAFGLQPVDALTKALQDLTGSEVNSSSLRSVESPSAENPYLLMTADKGANSGFSFFDEPARIKKVFYHLVDEYVPAYYVEADVYLPSTSGNVLLATGGYVPEERAYSYVISATDGQVLFRNNLISEQKIRGDVSESNLAPGGFTYKVWADPATGIPYDTPAGNLVHPKVLATADGAQSSFVAQQNVQLPNYPFSMNDPWLAPGATQTNGNNVDAFVNLFSPDDIGTPTTTTPTDPPNGDHRAQITSADQFLHTHQPDVDAFSVSARSASITQLFYNINFLHDWFYDAGFNEASGNAQKNNYGRGGLQNDDIKGQAQDFQSFSNANMLTPADGGRPRMRMYNFPNLANMLDIQAPAGIVNKVFVGISQTGTRNFDVSNDIVIATFTAGPTTCTITNAAALAGKIAMFDFDNTDGTGCSFSTRITRIHATSAAAALMVYTSGNATAVANITGINPAHTKPIGVISWNNGQIIKGVIGANTVTARLLRMADRDGSLDQQIVFHEWGHYISNRLIGNGNGLNTNYSGGLGEGWGDFTAMLLTAREDDPNTPSNANWNGAYALATYATSGVPFNGSTNQGYYFGIRRYPYSTDLAINPLTFKHIANGEPLPVGPPVAFGANGASNSEVHNTGEVWSMMLWECYAGLLRDTQGATPRLTFQEAQDRMKNYLVAGYKMTPFSPTLLEARDAVLAAAFAYDYNDGRVLAQAFAKRGAGVGAISPDRFSLTNSPVTESFSAGGALQYVSSSLDDSVRSCDNDNYLDQNEKGLLSVTLKNTGDQNLFNTTATVSSTNPNISFPNGNTITFPASQPNLSVTGTVQVDLAPVAGIQNVDFTITFSDSVAPVSPVVAQEILKANVDEIPASTATDTVEAKGTVWTKVTNPNNAPNLLGVGPAFEWNRVRESASANHVWSVVDAYVGSDQTLKSPVFTVDGSGSVTVQFDHSFAFEFDGGGNYDGARVEYSVNGGVYQDMGTSGVLPNYNGTILNEGVNGVNPLQGLAGFVKNSGGTIHTSFTRAIAPGSTVQVRFRAASDSSVGAAGWNVDNIFFTGVVETPFTTPVAEGDPCPFPPTPTPPLALSPTSIPAATVGVPYSVTLTASGGTSPYTQSVTPVVLPPGFSIINGGTTLEINGTPTQAGTYLLTVTTNDSASHSIQTSYPLVVNKATPVITWSNPADITYPTPLDGTQLNATADKPGTFTYTPPAATVLNAGNAQILSVNFVPTDTANYNNASASVQINVLKATPVVTWSNPASITYPAALGATELNATADVPGLFTYTPPAGTVLNAGDMQQLSVTFAPTDSTNYVEVIKNVRIDVLKATPVITWSNPADITYPTALSATQLNATASAPGAFTYTPPSGTVLNVGNAQNLSVNFVPTDTVNYDNASKNVLINVLKANQTITFGALSDRPLSNTTFSVSGTSTSSLPLTFTIFSGPATISSGVVTLTGVGVVTVRAAQAGDANYNAATPVNQSFTVTKALTTTAVSSSVNPSTLGQSVTFTATVVSTFGIPTGTVTFKDGAATLGSGPLNGSGSASITTSALSIGAHVITAEYAGDTNNLAGSATVTGGQQVNSPPNGVMQLSAANYAVGEAGGSIAITVSRTGDTSLASTVDYATDDGSNPSVNVPCSTVAGTARERCDYTRAVGTLQFAPGQASKTFTVLISDDSYVEGNETLQLLLSNPSAGSLLGSQTAATLTITDDDINPGANPVDNAGAFVTQLYHDFLNREPDSAGFNFWTNQITSCGSDQACISAKRVNVAASFFLSIEFQQTGYLVERLYKTAYGSATGSSTMGGAHTLPVPVIRFNEFLPDTQKIGLGVLVGQAGWETVLENNKVAFINEFVLRSRFTTAYPVGMTPATFVDTLNTNAGNPLSTAERNQLVADLTNSTKTRAQVLRAVAEHPSLVSAESNRAFVLMQYFGFLRRNPNDVPDTDYTGYDFWLTKLNLFGGNFVNADMVKGFITSAEYRQRFGTN